MVTKGTFGMIKYCHIIIKFNRFLLLLYCEPCNCFNLYCSSFPLKPTVYPIRRGVVALGQIISKKMFNPKKSYFKKQFA